MYQYFIHTVGDASVGDVSVGDVSVGDVVSLFLMNPLVIISTAIVILICQYSMWSGN